MDSIIPAAITPPDNSVAEIKATLVALQARLNAERKDRIERDLHELVIANKLTAAEVPAALVRCLADESYLAELKARPVIARIEEPMNYAATVAATGPMAEINKHAKGKDRFNFMRDNWSDLNASMPRSPQNANSVSATLVTAMLAEGTTTVLQNRLAPLKALSLELPIDRVKPLALIQHRKVTAGGTAQTNATSFEDTTNFVGTNTNVAITMAQLTSGGHCTNAERQSGHALAYWTTVKVAELSDAIMGAVAAKILTGTFTATPLTSAAAAFQVSDLRTLWGQLKKSPIKNLILDGEYYAQLLPAALTDFNVLTVGMPGWDTVALNTVWTGATANTVGFACNPQALVCGVGLPLRDPAATSVSTESVVSLPDLGVSVAISNWYSNITRANWITWDIMFGCAADDATAAVIIKSA